VPEIVVFLAIGLLIVLVNQLNERYLYGHYFNISQILTGIPSNVKRLGVPLRLVVPVVAGIVVGFLPLSNNLLNTLLLAALAAGFGAFLLVWPPLLRPESLPEELAERHYELRILYVAFVTFYSVLGALGGALAGLVLAILPLVWATLRLAAPRLTVEAIVQEAIVDLIVLVFFVILTRVAQSIFNRLRKRLQIE